MKSFKKIVALCLSVILSLCVCTVANAANETPFYENSRFVELSMDQADAKFDNGDTFIYVLYRPNCNNCAIHGKRVFSVWMNDYNTTIYGTDVSNLNSLPWFLYDEFVNKRIITPLVVFVKNGTYKTVMAFYDGVANDLNRNFCELRGVNYVPLEEVTFTESSVKITKGDTKQLELNFYPSTATIKGVYWESSDPDIVSISQDGVITGLKGGTAVIYAKPTDADVIYDKENLNPHCWVTVDVPVTGISLPESEVTLEVGDELILSPIYSPADATPKVMPYSTSNSNVLANQGRGVLKAVAPGTATATVYSPDRKYSASCKVTVVAAKVPVTDVAISKSSLSIEIGTNSILNVSVYPSNATNKKVSWISSNNSIVTVGSNGELTAKAIGTATITVKTDDGGYEAKCVVTVTPATPRINIKNNPQTRTINYGDILHIKAETKNVPDGARIQWKVSNDATGFNCYIDKNDNNSCYIQATGSGSCVVYAMLVDSSGNPILDSNGNEIYDSQTIKANSGIFQIIISFIKNLFGINRTVVQAIFKGIF